MTEAILVDGARPRLPVWQTVKAGYRYTFKHFGAFLRAAAVPLVLTLGLSLAIPAEGAGPGATVVSAVLVAVFVTLFEITWFRFLLFDSRSESTRLLPRFDGTFWRFLGYSLILMLPMAPAELLLLLIGYGPEEASAVLLVVAGLLYVLGLYVSLRISFCLLWITVGLPGRIGESWRHTRKNGLRLLLVMVILCLPLVLLLGAVGVIIAVLHPESMTQIETGGLEGSAGWLDLVATQVALFFFYGVSCGAFVQAFGVLTGWISDRRELLERFE